MSRRPERFPLLKEAFLHRRGASVYLAMRKPLRLDAAHRGFVDGIVAGGRSVRQLLEDLDSAGVFPGGRPSEAALGALLSQPESFIEIVPFHGRRSYRAVLVDLHQTPSPEIKALLRKGLPGAPGRVLALLAWDPGKLPETVDLVPYRKRAGDPCGTFYRFVQLARTLLLHVRPTRVFVSDLAHALFLLGGLERHVLGLGIRSTVAPYAIPGPLLLDSEDADPESLYLALLFWLRHHKKHEELALAVAQTSAASMAGWLALVAADRLFVQEQELVASLHRRSELIRVRCEGLTAKSVGEFLFSPSRAPAARDDAVLLGHDSPARRVALADVPPGRATALFGCAGPLETLLACTRVIRAYRRENPGVPIEFLTEDRPDTRVLELCPDIDVVHYAVTRSAPGVSSAEWVARRPEFQRHEGFRHAFDPLHAAGTRSADAVCRVLGDRVGVRVRGGRPVLSSRRVRRAVADPAPPEGGVLCVPRGALPSGPATPRGWAQSRWVQLARALDAALDCPVLCLTRSGGASRFGHGLALEAWTGREWAGCIARARLLVSEDPSAMRLAEAVGTPALRLDSRRCSTPPPGGSSRRCAVLATDEPLSVERVLHAVLALDVLRPRRRKCATVGDES